jgi:hypothetical protein
MRLLKLATLCLVACATMAITASAQQFGKFDDSWFWGAKAGAGSFTTSATASKTAPTFGLDWMITRTRGGLYVSADQSSFNRTVTLADASSANGKRQVVINDLRRVGFGGLVFPPPYGRMRAYAGLGAAISILGSAVAQNDSAGGAPSQDFINKTENARSRASLMAMFGGQIQFGRAAYFMQETILPSGAEFLVPSTMSFLEVGIRFNFGSSIDTR